MSARDTADQQRRIDASSHGVQLPLRKKAQHPALTRNLQALPAGHDLDGVEGLSGKAVCGGKYLQRSHEIEFLDGRYRDDDDSVAGRALAARAAATVLRGRHHDIPYWLNSSDLWRIGSDALR